MAEDKGLFVCICSPLSHYHGMFGHVLEQTDTGFYVQLETGKAWFYASELIEAL